MLDVAPSIIHAVVEKMYRNHFQHILHQQTVRLRQFDNETSGVLYVVLGAGTKHSHAYDEGQTGTFNVISVMRAHGIHYSTKMLVSSMHCNVCMIKSRP